MDVTELVLERLRDDASRYDEWATTRFWEYVLGKFYFKDPMWLVSSQQPPSEDTLRRIDIIVEGYGIITQGAISALIVKEAKKGKASPSELQVVEHQALTACYEYLIANERETIWAMTCFGTRARLWAAHREDDYLRPFFPTSDGLSAKEEYVDFFDNRDGFRDAFEYIKKNPEPQLQQGASDAPSLYRTHGQ